MYWSFPELTSAPWIFLDGYKYNVKGSFLGDANNRYNYKDCAEICEFHGDFVKVIEPRDKESFDKVMEAIGEEVTLTSSHAFWINDLRESSEL